MRSKQLLKPQPARHSSEETRNRLVEAALQTLTQRGFAGATARAARHLALGELGLDGRLAPVSGTLPAAMAAHALDIGIICPVACGPEAASSAATSSKWTSK